MDHFIEIRVLPDPEFKEEMLMSALFAKLHRALGARGKGDIGVSFPEHSVKPGSVIRLHGQQSALKELEAGRWRAGLNDYCAATAVQSVPEIKGWRTVARVQVKSSAARLLRRSVRKGWITEEEAELRLGSVKEDRCSLPFIQMISLSSKENFRLFIQHGELKQDASGGLFSTYGLSAEATIPWF